MAIEAACAALHGGILVVGTVLNVEDAKRAMIAGAKFLMSPAMVKRCFQVSTRSENHLTWKKIEVIFALSDGSAGWSNPSEPTTDSAIPELNPLAVRPLFPPLRLRYQMAHPQSPRLSQHCLPLPLPQNGDVTHNDGHSIKLLQADDIIPMSFQGVTYNIPIIMESYPCHPPVVYVNPTLMHDHQAPSRPR
ncbi:hypothetical protein ACE6H2_006461 [Prunus campanulata]